MSDYDPTDTRSQERRQEDAATRAKLLSDTEKSDVKWLMSSRRGRGWNGKEIPDVLIRFNQAGNERNRMKQ